MLEIKHFRSSVRWTQLGYFRFAFVPKPTANPAERIAGGKEEQGSGRMTFFCSAGIKERRSKADFAPTWRSGWDSNPRALADNLISSQARYDHFDTSPYDLNAKYYTTKIPVCQMKLLTFVII